MGLCYQTSRWLDRLWGEHVESSACCRQLLVEGIRKQGNPFAGFPADLHARLYLSNDPVSVDGAPGWACRLHAMTRELAEWHQLKLMTARNGFAAGVAAEVMLGTLLPHVPERPEASADDAAPEEHEDPNQQHTAPDEPSDGDLRAALRRATRKARAAVQDAESALEGLGAGSGMAQDGRRMNLKAIREACAALEDSRRLKEIARLAGRFERIAAAKARTRVNPGAGEVHGIIPGGDLDRLLPSELLFLKHPLLKRTLLARLLERSALNYAMRGREPLGRGPVLILLDESGSMGEYGRDVWSRAVALAVLNAATKENRPVRIAGFTRRMEQEVSFVPGKWTVHDVRAALDAPCSGGTSFDVPVQRACELIGAPGAMKQADVLLITDGEQTLSEKVTQQALELTHRAGVSWFVVGIGTDAIRAVPRAFGQIAATMHLVARLDDVDAVVPIISLPQTNCRSPQRPLERKNTCIR